MSNLGRNTPRSKRMERDAFEAYCKMALYMLNLYSLDHLAEGVSRLGEVESPDSFRLERITALIKSTYRESSRRQKYLT